MKKLTAAQKEALKGIERGEVKVMCNIYLRRGYDVWGARIVVIRRLIEMGLIIQPPVSVQDPIRDYKLTAAGKRALEALK